MSAKQTSVLCPNCGRSVALSGDSAGMQTCAHCSTSFFHAPEAENEADLQPGSSRRESETQSVSQTDESNGNVDDLDGWLPKPATPPAEDEEGYRLRAEETPFPVARRPRAPIPPAGVSAALAKPGVKAAPLPPPPKWLFLSGVFSFPWYPGTVWRWLFATLGLLIAGFCLVLVLYLRTLLGFGFMLPVFIFAFAVAGSAMAANGLAVFEDTAHGHDAIHNWPENDIRDLFPAFVGLLYLGMIAGMAGLLFGRPWQAAPVWGAALGLYVLLPILLLSSQEADSIVAPLSWPVLRSLYLCPGSWLGFYVVTGILLAGTAVACVFATISHRFLGATVVAILVPAVALIYPRLLGRLAWRIMREEQSRADDMDA